ncbi:MAG: LptF/LptG family permease [Elusimicrobia bacterium]|nr:LptF/LptG family permease [Elusimicrobiota bacterium]
MRIPIAQRYILRSFAKFFALSLFIFTALFVMLNFVQIVNQGVLGGFSLYFLAKSMAYLLPNIVSMSLPLAFLLGLLLSLAQMSQEGEIVALRAGGFSFSDILSRIFSLAVLCSLLLLAVNNWLGPEGFKKSNDYTFYMLNRVTKIELKPRTFQKVSDWVIYAREVNNITGKLRYVQLIKRLNKGETPVYVNKINSAEGRYEMVQEKGMEITLAKGQFTQTDCKNDEKLIYGEFSAYKTLIPFISGNVDQRALSPMEYSSPDLLGRLKAGVINAENAVRYRVEIVSRLTFALTPIVFFLIGAPLGVVLDKKGRSAGFSLSLLIIFFYYGLTLTGVVLAKKYSFLFPWAVFTPAVFAAAAGIWLWRKRLYAR